MRTILLCVFCFNLAAYFGSADAAAVPLSEADCLQESSCDAITNPNCHFPDYTDCRFYKQCFIQGRRWRGFLKACPFGQLWNSQLPQPVCDYHYRVNCTADICKINSALRSYTNLHTLTNLPCNRQYWECVGSRSVPRCCREGLTYDETTRKCIEGIEGKCLGKCSLSPNAVCEYEPEGFKFGMNNEDCRKHMECQNKTAIAACCGESHRFLYGKCVYDPGCRSNCGQKPPPPPIAKPVVCPRQQPACPVGTILGKLANGCPGCVPNPIIKRITPAVNSTAQCLNDIMYVYSDFNETRLNVHNVVNNAPTATKIWVGGDNIVAKGGNLVVGKTNNPSHPSYLSFPWFHGNIEARNKIYVELMFKPETRLNHQTGFTVLSDCCSDGGGPSFSVTATPRNTLFISVKTKIRFVYIHLKYEPNSWNTVRIKYDGFQLSATNSFLSKALKVTEKVPYNEVGKMVIARHPLNFGTCQQKGRPGFYPDPKNKCKFRRMNEPSDQFHGELDYIKIWGCKTGWDF